MLAINKYIMELLLSDLSSSLHLQLGFLLDRDHFGPKLLIPPLLLINNILILIVLLLQVKFTLLLVIPQLLNCLLFIFLLPAHLITQPLVLLLQVDFLVFQYFIPFIEVLAVFLHRELGARFHFVVGL